MLHVKEGLYFERQKDGCVKMVLKHDAKVVAEVVREIEMSPEAWQTVVDQMSKPDELIYGQPKKAG